MTETHGGMPDLFEMAREGDEGAMPVVGEYDDGGHGAVVDDIVVGDGVAWSTNTETGEQSSEVVMLLGFETIGGTRHMFTLRFNELAYLIEQVLDRVLPAMLEDRNPDRNKRDKPTT